MTELSAEAKEALGSAAERFEGEDGAERLAESYKQASRKISEGGAKPFEGDYKNPLGYDAEVGKSLGLESVAAKKSLERFKSSGMSQAQYEEFVRDIQNEHSSHVEKSREARKEVMTTVFGKENTEEGITKLERSLQKALGEEAGKAASSFIRERAGSNDIRVVQALTNKLVGANPSFAGVDAKGEVLAPSKKESIDGKDIEIVWPHKDAEGKVNLGNFMSLRTTNNALLMYDPRFRNLKSEFDERRRELYS